MPQEQSCAGVMSSISRNEDIYIRMETKYLGRTALWVVLRLGRTGGTFSSSSRKCHRPIKAPFLSFFVLFLWLWGQMDLSLSRGMDQHLSKLAFSLRPDMTPRTLGEMYSGMGVHPSGDIFAPFAFLYTAVLLWGLECLLWFCGSSPRLRWRGPSFVPWWQASLM